MDLVRLIISITHPLHITYSMRSLTRRLSSTAEQCGPDKLGAEPESHIRPYAIRLVPKRHLKPVEGIQKMTEEGTLNWCRSAYQCLPVGDLQRGTCSCHVFRSWVCVCVRQSTMLALTNMCIAGPELRCVPGVVWKSGCCVGCEALRTWS